MGLTNRPGSGATLVIRLPLSMAVTRIVTVDCNGRLFGIPMDLVVETVRVPQASIRRINNAEAFVLRNRMIPVARLGALLGLGDGAPTGEDEAVMVVNLAGDRVGVVVGGFRERLEAVVKPLSGIWKACRDFRAQLCWRRPGAADPRSQGVAVMPFRVEDGVVSSRGPLPGRRGARTLPGAARSRNAADRPRQGGNATHGGCAGADRVARHPSGPPPRSCAEGLLRRAGVDAKGKAPTGSRARPPRRSPFRAMIGPGELYTCEARVTKS